MKQTTIRLPDQLHKQLKEEAKQRGMTLNAYIVSILWRKKEFPDCKLDYLFKTEGGE